LIIQGLVYNKNVYNSYVDVFKKLILDVRYLYTGNPIGLRAYSNVSSSYNLTFGLVKDFRL